MDDRVAAALMTVIPLAPLAALLVLVVGRRWLSDRQAAWMCAVAAGMSCGAAAAALGLMAAARWPSGGTVRLVDWLALDGGSLHLPIALQLDRLSAAVAAATALAVACVTLHVQRRGGRDVAGPSFYELASLILFAVLMTLQSPNLLAWFLFWELTAVAVWRLADQCSSDATADAAPRRMLLTVRMTDSLFVVGIAMAWGRLGLIDFSQLSSQLASLLSAELPDDVLLTNRAVLSVIATCFFVGAAGRCAQFPFFGWLHDAANHSASAGALVQGLALAPAGVLLVARCEPLYAAAPDIRLLAAVLGGMTALMASMVAATGPTPRHALGSLTASLCGWMFLGLGSGDPIAASGAAILLLAMVLAGTALWLSLGDEAPTARSAVGLIACLMLASGFWGQQAILSAYWSRTAETPEAFATLSPLVLAFGFASVVLGVFSLIRASLLAGPSATAKARPEETARIAQAMVGPWLLAAAALALLPLEPHFAMAPEGEVAARDPLLTGLVVFCVLLGLSAAWGLYARPSPWPERLARRLGPLTRLSRHRFYVDRATSAGVTMPLRVAGQLARFADWLIIDALLVGLPRRLAGWPARLSSPMQDAPAQFYALAVLLAMAVLVLILACG